MSTNQSVQQSQYLTFVLGEDEYAIGILSVKEIIEYGTITRLPKAPQFIRGVINLRGTVVPVLDLAAKFDLPQSPVTPMTCIILVDAEINGESLVIGVLADSVEEVIDVAASEIEPAPSFGTNIRGEFLKGIAKLGNKLAIVLDLDKVLSDAEVSQVNALGAQGTPETVEA